MDEERSDGRAGQRAAGITSGTTSGVMTIAFPMWDTSSARKQAHHQHYQSAFTRQRGGPGMIRRMRSIPGNGGMPRQISAQYAAVTCPNLRIRADGAASPPRLASILVDV